MSVKEKIEALEALLPELFEGIEPQILKFIHLREGLDSQPTDLVSFLSHRNRSIMNSKYYWEGEQLVHFTNLNSLNSIIKSKVIRLYDLNNLNDPLEFKFAGKKLRISAREVSNAKQKMFIMSFCNPKIFDEPSVEFNMWRLYGQDGRGVAILFSRLNDPQGWKDFHISQVFYGDENRKVFSKLNKLVAKLNATPPRVYVDLTKLLLFHKSALFSSENEVRIIDDRREKVSGSSSQIWFDSISFSLPEIKTDYLKLAYTKKVTNFIEIPVFTDGFLSQDSTIPNLRIDQILLGYNYSKAESNKMIGFIAELCIQNLGYLPDIKHTNLRKSYLDISKG